VNSDTAHCTQAPPLAAHPPIIPLLKDGTSDTAHGPQAPAQGANLPNMPPPEDGTQTAPHGTQAPAFPLNLAVPGELGLECCASSLTTVSGTLGRECRESSNTTSPAATAVSMRQVNALKSGGSTPLTPARDVAVAVSQGQEQGVTPAHSVQSVQVQHSVQSVQLQRVSPIVANLAAEAAAILAKQKAHGGLLSPSPRSARGRGITPLPASAFSPLPAAAPSPRSTVDKGTDPVPLPLEHRDAPPLSPLSFLPKVPCQRVCLGRACAIFYTMANID
jgi:hypothetical protein